MKKIQIYDTTLRDGEQAPGAAMTPEQKLSIAIELEELGVQVIEAGFPAASKNDLFAVSEISKICQKTTIAAFARTTTEDIQAAAYSLEKAKNPRITLVMPSSDLHLKKKLRINYIQAMDLLTNMVSLAKNYCSEVEVILEDATRANPNFLAELYKISVHNGAKYFTIADTVGYATPVDIENIFKIIKEQELECDIPTLGIHCHDDLGLATINTITGLMNGANQAHCTINGIGERAGNACLEEIVMAITVRPDRLPFLHQINTQKIWQLSQLVSQYTKLEIAPNKSIVGKNAFAHGSGLHQDGMLKDINMYEIMLPEIVGAPDRSLPITRHSGRKGLLNRLSLLQVELEDREFEDLYNSLSEILGDDAILNDEDLIRYLNKMK
jgi:2-isopropylmalate synthase